MVRQLFAATCAARAVRVILLNAAAILNISALASAAPAADAPIEKRELTIQEKALDWLSFWLTGREDPSPDKREQYARWRAFRAAPAVADLQGGKEH